MRVLVSGASGPVAAGAARRLAGRGHHVVGLDPAPAADSSLPVVRCDAADDDDVLLGVHEAVERLGGGLDVLVNAGARGHVGDAGRAPDASARALLDVNLLGPWRTTAAALPALLHPDGPRPRVVTVSSALSGAAPPYLSAWSASQRAVTAWMDTLRQEYGAHLDVVTVHPGHVGGGGSPPDGVDLGVSLDGVLPREPPEAGIAALVRACEGPARREVATSAAARATLVLARHAPRLTEAVSRRRRGPVRASGPPGPAVAAGARLARSWRR